MEQLVILLVIGIISLVNWLMQRSAEIREQRKAEAGRLGIPEGNPFQPAEEKPAAKPVLVKDPAREMRKLMEALGLPLEDEEPLVRRELPPAPEIPPLPAYQPKSPAEKPAGKFFPAAPAAPAPPVARTTLSQALLSRDGVRQAFVLREILGPPKAFTL